MAFSLGPRSIASLSSQCHASLETLCEKLLEPEPETPGDLSEDAAPQALSALGRLNLWQDEVECRDGSLDHALRKASHLSERVSELLEDLNTSIGYGLLHL